MSKLTEPLKEIISNFSVGAVASVNDDGTPAVSPKATFVILDDYSIAFGDIRSPGTVSNLQKRPNTEINFVDILNRKAARVRGTAKVIAKDSDSGQQLISSFEKHWAPYVAVMKNFVVIQITEARLVTSPAYDLGATSEELRKINLEKLTQLNS